MQTVSLPEWSLLVLRCAVLPVYIGAILFSRRNPLNGDPGARQAGMAGISVTLAGVTSVSFATSLPMSGGAAMIELASSLLLVGLAGVLVWMSCRAGIVLGMTQGGYWRKEGAGGRSAMWAGVGGVALVLSFSVPLFVAMGLELPPGAVPASPREWAAWLPRMYAFSFGEEAVHRGWALAWLCAESRRRHLNPWSANLLVAMLFAGQHTGGIYQMLIAFWAGLVMGAVFLRHGLIAAAALHFMINLAVPLFVFLP